MSEKNKVVSYPVRPRKKLTRRALKLAIGLLIVVAAVLYTGQMLTFWEASRELHSLEKKRQAIEAENELLREEMILLQDNEYVEIKAREKLGLVRPGEMIFYVVD